MGVEQIGKEPKSIQDKVIEVARLQVAEGADSIILGCTIVAAYFDYENVPDDLKGIPILDANVAALKTLEVFAELQITSNITVSRKTYVKTREAEPEAYQHIRSTLAM
jgi:Asp/Glu/hydantoin racemase